MGPRGRAPARGGGARPSAPALRGDAPNPVIFHSDRALHAAGLTTLRFNFRGVGESDGYHDDGRGEVADVAAAADWLRAAAAGAPLLVVGYSFGARCGLLHAVDDPDVAGIVAIGLPVRLWRFEEVAALGKPFAVVQGSEDEFGSIEDVRRVLERANPGARLLVVPGATHLFPGRAPEAAERVAEAVEGLLDFSRGGRDPAGSPRRPRRSRKG